MTITIMIVQIVIMILAIISGINHWNAGEHQRFTSFCVLFLLQVINISYDNIEKEISGILIQPIFDDLLLLKERGIFWYLIHWSNQIVFAMKQVLTYTSLSTLRGWQWNASLDVVRWFHVYEYILHTRTTQMKYPILIV